MPNVMLEKGLSCKGCHMFHEETGGRLVKSETLISGERGLRVLPRPGLRPDPQELGDLDGEEARRGQTIIYESGRGRGPGGQGARRGPRPQALLRRPPSTIDVVDKGKSVHNITYSQELLPRLPRQDRPGPEAAAGSSYKPGPDRVLHARRPGTPA